MNESENKNIKELLEKVPGVRKGIGDGFYENGLWWIKFQIDIKNKYAWSVIQELSCVINYLSVEERLPTIFYPVSPAPYLNGGPSEFLSWIIENNDTEFTSNNLKELLENRLPNPIDDLESWDIEND